MIESEIVAHLWAAGQLVPHRITESLDRAGLMGPEVDRLCEAQEPEVDEWEAGTRYPKLVQVRALADLCDVQPMRLFMPTDQDSFRITDGFICGAGGCKPLRDDGVERVLSYPLDVVRATVGDG